ncbi:MAG: hypothetical protein ACJ74W_22070 [Pyrinomonadaceae bacterium]
MAQSTNWPVKIVFVIVAFVVAATCAVALWYGMAYLGMSVIIPLDFITHAFAWMHLGPAGAWLLWGCLIGGLVGWVKALYSFGRKSQATAVLALSSVFILVLWGTSYAVTGRLEKIARARARAEQRAREEAASRKIREAEENVRLDKAYQEGVLWQAVKITNKTNNKIFFQILNNKGQWKEYSLRPGYELAYWDKVREIKVSFDNNYAYGKQELQTTIISLPIIGHEPTKADQAQATSHYFQANGNTLYLN